MKYVYPACFQIEDNGCYSVDMPDFQLVIFGDDLANAIYMASDAAAGRILELMRDGNPIPVASDINKIKPTGEAGFVSLIYVDLDTLKSNHDETLVKKTLTIPSWLNQAAERKKMNFSATLKDALIEKLAL